MKEPRIKVSYLKLLDDEKNSDRIGEVRLDTGRLETVSDLRRRGQFYDYVLGSLRDYARKVDPSLTFDLAAEMLIDLPLFVSGLQVNWNGSGFIRELPNLLRQEARTQ